MVEVTNVKRHKGIAGQFSVSADVQYPSEPGCRIEFVGNASGGPVVIVTPTAQMFVSSQVLERIGSKLDESWVRRFFAQAGE